MEEQSNIITLTDESGENVEFEFIDLVPYNGEEYIVLLPVEDADDATEVVILKVETCNDAEEQFVSVDDESTLDAVFECFKQKYTEFDFND